MASCRMIAESSFHIVLESSLGFELSSTEMDDFPVGNPLTELGPCLKRTFNHHPCFILNKGTARVNDGTFVARNYFGDALNHRCHLTEIGTHIRAIIQGMQL